MLSSSRHRFSVARRDAFDRLALSPPEPFRYVDLPDNVEHVAKSGDTPWSIAAEHYADLPDGALFFWVIVDFQPEPVFHDPTLQIPEGTVVYVPSVRTLETRILNPARGQAT